jgi:hypothetical protein
LLSPDAARREARKLLGQVAAGEDPAGEKAARRQADTVNDLLDRYVQATDAGRLITRRGTVKKGDSWDIDRGRIDRHLRPLIGTVKLAELSRGDIVKAMHDIAGGKDGRPHPHQAARLFGHPRRSGRRGPQHRVVVGRPVIRLDDMAAEAIAQGRLIRVLEDWCEPFPGYHICYPSRRQLSPALRLLTLRFR